MTLHEFVTAERKALDVRVEATPIRYTVSNFGVEGQPLPGWEWDAPDVEGYGASLEEAWGRFHESLLEAPDDE